MRAVELIVRFIFALQKKSYIWTLSIFFFGGGGYMCPPHLKKTDTTMKYIYMYMLLGP